MLTLKEYSDYINRSIEKIKYPAEPKGLYQPIAYTLDCGGKRLRPMLIMAVAEALGAAKENVINQALGLEMFHNFTLLHDDVMDHADMRRGKPTVHIKWNESTAILSGDAMLTMATQLISTGCGSHLTDVLALFNSTAMEIYEGQQYDMDFEQRLDVSVAEYIEMIRLKTSVLLGCACRIGAIMADADETTCDAFYNYGIAMGLAFQLQDDYLDTYGDPKVFGKKIGGDILNDKKTFLLITALNSADDDTWKQLTSLTGVRSESKIEQVKRIYDRLEVAADCQSLMHRYITKAIDYINTINISADAKQFFIDLANVSVNRKS
jgi:geranylgeranyl diphosphate synthase type II